MEKAEPPSYPPADLRRRAVARALDLCVGLAPLLLMREHARAGELLSLALILCADALFGTGRSLGKRAAGLRVVQLATRRPAGIAACLRRNAVFAVAVLPAVLGVAHPVAVTVAVLAVLLAVETGVALQPLTRDLGARRIGDLIAGTQVIDASLALGLKEPVAQNAARAAAGLAASRAAHVKLEEEPPVARAGLPANAGPSEEACASP
ncbi:MAG: RDD family protein [Deltaproteobacteria bacterium]|nr:MAG: RDD family protein [Deltaproteobacteria bacterium]